MKKYFFQHPINYLTPLILLLLLNSCSRRDKNKLDLLYSLQGCSKLATTEIILSKLVFARKENRILFIPLGDAHFAANTYAYVKYGIDFNKLNSRDINTIDNTFEITLPPFEIISFSYPSEEFDLIDDYTDSSLFTKFTYDEVDEIFRHAELQLWKKLEKIQLAKSIRENTTNVLKAFLGSAGYDKVIIHYSDELT